jgi:hypothetical protein
MTHVPPLQLIVGPEEHGVVAYAADVAAALRETDDRTEVAWVDSLPGAQAVARRAGRAHLHVTDRLLGRSPEEAADRLEGLASVTALTVTVHDVPQTSDGTGLERRVAAYTRMFAAVDAAAVNSQHEQRLVADFLPGVATPHAIPLGARRSSPSGLRSREHDAARSGRRDLVVLLAGYIYPGKGHAQAIEAAADAARALRRAGEPVGAVVVRAIGAPSTGHEGDVAVLRNEAERLGVRFDVTGFLAGPSFDKRMMDEGIPLAAHEHVSASRSMLDWVEVGRRPLVVDSRYAREMDRLRPRTIARYEPAELALRLVEAWRDPKRTTLPAGASLRPTLADVAEDYLSWWNGPAR